MVKYGIPDIRLLFENDPAVPRAVLSHGRRESDSASTRSTCAIRRLRLLRLRLLPGGTCRLLRCGAGSTATATAPPGGRPSARAWPSGPWGPRHGVDGAHRDGLAHHRHEALAHRRPARTRSAARRGHQAPADPRPRASPSAPAALPPPTGQSLRQHGPVHHGGRCARTSSPPSPRGAPPLPPAQRRQVVDVLLTLPAEADVLVSHHRRPSSHVQGAAMRTASSRAGPGRSRPSSSSSPSVSASSFSRIAHLHALLRRLLRGPAGLLEVARDRSR